MNATLTPQRVHAKNAAMKSGGEGALFPFNGEWTFARAAHLLRRSTFGPTKALIEQALELGLESTMEKLFQPLPLPAPPVNIERDEDRNVPYGETWVNAPYSTRNFGKEVGARERSLRGWAMGCILEEGISIREKLTLFWHNHFPINEILDPKLVYAYVDTLRRNALGNFKTLAEEITIEPAMLIFLDGNRNTNNRPNENYARELFELFTIGKGPLAGPGDYTTFTEHDVLEAARVLTGWTDVGYGLDSRDGQVGARFVSREHDKDVKVLSHRFGGALIENQEEEEYKALIDIIFEQEEVARHICRKLYRWFVYYKIDDRVEAEVIAPMARMLYDSDYEIRPALSALLSSEHFFEPANIGIMIKSPADFVASAVKPLLVEAQDEPQFRYYSWYALEGRVRGMQMNLFQVPEVAGWRAYYLEPVYYRAWLSASTLPPRMSFIEQLSSAQGIPGFGGLDGQLPLKVDVRQFLATLEAPYDPSALIEDAARVLLPVPLSEAQTSALRDILLNGVPDYDWPTMYYAYVENPGDQTFVNRVESRVSRLLRALMSMPEFYLQ
jgi:uncharacterized protein (DUF1800 family)